MEIEKLNEEQNKKITILSYKFILKNLLNGILAGVMMGATALFVASINALWIHSLFFCFFMGGVLGIFVVRTYNNLQMETAIDCALKYKEIIESKLK